MLIGYARVSTDGQDLTPQLDALNAAGCERTFSEKGSGASMDRPQLAAALDFMRAGDTLVVWKLDRLGRDMRGLVQLSRDLAERNLHLKSLTDNVDTSTPTGRFFFHIMSSFAEMERELARERTMIGLAAARERGKKAGRPPVSQEQRRLALTLFANPEITMEEVARRVGCSVATLYRVFTPAERNRLAGEGGRSPRKRGRPRKLASQEIAVVGAL